MISFIIGIVIGLAVGYYIGIHRKSNIQISGSNSTQVQITDKNTEGK